MKTLISLLTMAFLTGCGVFGVRTAEEPDYQVLHDYGKIQIRRYPALVVAETAVMADYRESSNQAFRRLAAYIFGKNQKQQKIPMTAPVIQQQPAETLAMTAPVLQQRTGSVWMMVFVLPKGYSLATAPVPLDKAVVIKEMPAQKVAVIRYSGRLTEKGIDERAGELTEWLSQQGYKAISFPRSAAYDPPWTLPFLRRNEVHIDIEPQ